MNLINSQEIKINKEDEILIFDTNLFTLLALKNYKIFQLFQILFGRIEVSKNFESN